MVKVVYYTSAQSDLYPVIKATKSIIENYGQVIRVFARSQNDLSDDHKVEKFISEARSAHLVIVHLHGGKDTLPGFDRLVTVLKETGVPLHIQGTPSEDDRELRMLYNLSSEEHCKIKAYIDYGGVENFLNLSLWAANRYGAYNFDVKEPKPLPWEGIYHPSFPSGVDLESYLAWRCLPGRLTVGILFYQSLWVAQNTAFVDALINAVEQKNEANVLPVFLHATRDIELGSKGLAWVAENYFMRNNQPVIDVLISTLMFSHVLTAKEENFYKRLGVPVIKAILSFNDYESWAGSLQGLNPMDISINVAMPEFDGALITVLAATREYGEQDPLTGARIVYYRPVEERVEKIVRLALNWARLKRKPSSEKKIAIIFHNYPPRNDTIGSAFGLDSFASVVNILRGLKEAGYKLDHLPENGQELIEEILKRATNDWRMLSAEQMATLAIDVVSRQEYAKWFEGFSEKVREQMENDWGPPPGEVFNCGGKLLIPGIINGNIFIGLQPPRGFLEDPAKIYHSPDVSPTHHYLAYYRWIRDDFGADAILHIGKHGSLEWLPGKSVGLSSCCYPDLAISDLPHIYPYIINNPGEGTQAKRRSYCCIIDHLIPVMTNAGAYDELAELEVRLEEYYRARALDPGKLPYLKRMIWEKVESVYLNRDLDFDWEKASQNFEEFIERLHSYLSEIKDTQIRNGLHIFGQPPEGSKLIEMLVALTRLNNGSIPSLRQSVAEALGYNYEELLAERGKFNVLKNKTSAQIIDEINSLISQIVEEFYHKNFNPAAIKEICQKFLNCNPEKVESVLNYMATVLAPRLKETTDEIKNTLDALAGSFVPPGPSGAPTRGMADILPTGRNFYSVDPQTIPTPAAWEVGVALGDALLARYLADEGKYPQSVGVVIWGSPTMRTGGDDIAEVLYLMGVKPVWEKKSGRVKGLAIIPDQELGRPRLDVTVRISGFFRDAFPNIVALLDEAVELVANLPEGEVENYLARHVKEEIRENTARGVEAKVAREMALYRIFGCRPGAYGAGVSEAVDSKNWKDEKDLGQIYVTWGGYAYGRKQYGTTVPGVFKKRLSRIDLTVKNEDSREYDLLDSDDNYSYHGGMIAAVKAFSGELPCSYSGDSSDPDRVKVRSIAEEAKHVFRSRILNPRWIESMKRHGYKGAGDLSRMVDICFGWDATASAMENWMYEEMAKKYALDPQMQKWLKEINPWALQNIAERLLEAVERKMWEASPEMVEKLKEIYLDVEGELEARTDFR